MANKAFYLDKNIFHQKFIDNFWSKVNKNREDGCWEWMGQKNNGGYGRVGISINKKQKDLTCHRVSYALANGNVPEGLMVMHKCNARFCVNPSHLEVGTCADNLGYAASLNRMPKGDNHGRRKYPELWPKGKDHWTNANKESIDKFLRGENNPDSRLTNQQVLEIRNLYSTGKYFQRVLAEMFKVKQTTISLIILRKTWIHI